MVLTCSWQVWAQQQLVRCGICCWLHSTSEMITHVYSVCGISGLQLQNPQATENMLLLLCTPRKCSDLAQKRSISFAVITITWITKAGSWSTYVLLPGWKWWKSWPLNISQSARHGCLGCIRTTLRFKCVLRCTLGELHLQRWKIQDLYGVWLNCEVKGLICTWGDSFDDVPIYFITFRLCCCQDHAAFTGGVSWGARLR